MPAPPMNIADGMLFQTPHFDFEDIGFPCVSCKPSRAGLVQQDLFQSHSSQSTRSSSPLSPLDRSGFAWSRGSELHASRQCRPCAWFWKPQGCANGMDCLHCHSCPQDEIKNRKKAKHFAMNHRLDDAKFRPRNRKNIEPSQNDLQNFHQSVDCMRVNPRCTVGGHDMPVALPSRVLEAEIPSRRIFESMALSTNPLRPDTDRDHLKRAFAPGLVPTPLPWSEPYDHESKDFLTYSENS